MKRALSTSNLFAIEHDVFELQGDWRKAIGNPERYGAWLIWGQEKNGKTTFAMLLADMLSVFEKLLYISGEEGTGKAFVQTVKRIGINPANKRLQWQRYISIKELYIVLNSRRAPKIVVIDNVTVYSRELNNGRFEQLLKDFPEVLFIFLAHEEDGKPYTAAAKLIKRLSKLIFYVEGMTIEVGGRTEACNLFIDETKSAVIYGQQILNN